jgi:diadenosine tetraphosphate (Ap4A) HIT family hydrolase
VTGPGGDGVTTSSVTTTAIHRLVEACRAGADPRTVARLPSGWVVMGEPQVLPGYCLLLPDPVVPDLNALSVVPRHQFLADMAYLGDVLLSVTRAVRINYAMFGNVEPALHAHLFPRLKTEPASTRTAQPWALDWQAAPPYCDAQHGDLKARIAAGIAATATSRI